MFKRNHLFKVSIPCILFSIFIIFSGCNSLPGDGGTSSISGKVYVLRYNASGFLYQEYYGPEENVYIIYGDGTAIDDDTETSFDGSYTFNFLREGKYKIFVYSDCVGCPGDSEVIIQEIEITKNNQEVVLNDIIIENR